jgi:cyclase
VFRQADVDAALAASAFHSGAMLRIPELKQALRAAGIEVRHGS